MGKLPIKDLKKLLGCIKNDPKVVVSPNFGYDSGVHLIDGNKYLVVSTDPCVGVPEEWFGWLLIHYVASDIALFGAKMQFCAINLLASPTTKPAVFQKIMRQSCDAADELEVTIVTGHTGTYEGISTIIGVCTGYGLVTKDRLKTPGDAKPEDHIVCIKPIGLETAINFAFTNKAMAERLFGVKRTNELMNLITLQSCVKEAIQLAEIKGVHAMHDATEGGLIAALNELAEASKVGFKVEFEKLVFPNEAYKLKDEYGLSDLQMLSLSSTGTIVAAVSSEARDKVEASIGQNGVEVRFLGSFTENPQRILVKNKEEEIFPEEADDPYAKLILEKW